MNARVWCPVRGYYVDFERNGGAPVAELCRALANQFHIALEEIANMAQAVALFGEHAIEYGTELHESFLEQEYHEMRLANSERLTITELLKIAASGRRHLELLLKVVTDPDKRARLQATLAECNRLREDSAMKAREMLRRQGIDPDKPAKLA